LQPDPPEEKKLPPVVYRLGWISFFADVCSEMAYPIMPLFIVSVLNAPKFALGIIEGIALAVVNFMRGWSGFKSDQIGKRAPFIQVGYLTSGLSKPIIGLAHAWPTVLGARILDRFGKGVRTTARDAMLADSVDKTQYGKAYGLHQGMDTAGAFVGVILTLLLLWLWTGTLPTDSLYRRIFYLAAIPGFIAWLITLTLKDQPQAANPKPQDPQLSTGPAAERPSFAWSSLSGAYWRAVVISSVFALANSSDTFLMLRGHDVGLSDFYVVLAYALYNLVFGLLSYPVGKLSDKLGRWPTLFIGWLIYAAVYFGFAFTNAFSIWLLFAAYGISIGTVTAVNKALVADLSPPEFKGSAMGVFQVATGVATLIASPIVGLVWDRFGAGGAFQLGAAFALIAVVLIPLTGALKKRPITDR
jgi:MFS family permease